MCQREVDGSNGGSAIQEHERFVSQLNGHYTYFMRASGVGVARVIAIVVASECNTPSDGTSVLVAAEADPLRIEESEMGSPHLARHHVHRKSRVYPILCIDTQTLNEGYIPDGLDEGM